MNRKQRRQQSRSKTTARRAGVTYLAVAGLAGGSLGITSTAQAAPALITNCTELETQLNNAYTLGGVINANFSGTCDFAEGFIFGGETTITGPTDRSLTIRFGDSATTGFSAQGNLTVSNLNFTVASNNSNLDYFIYGLDPQGLQYPTLSISNSTFSDTVASPTPSNALTAAIYVEGQLAVSDSTYTNLRTILGAIYTSGTTNVSDSLFESNSGGGILTYGPLTVTGSTFNLNRGNTQGAGGAINSNSSATIRNSTFHGNTAETGGAVISSGSSTIENSSFDANEASTQDGGALFINGDANIQNSTFDANTAAMDGGAIYAAGSAGSTINNSTFVNNLANDAGAAIRMFSEGGGLVSNSTFWNNTGFPSQDSTVSLYLEGGYSLFANILANSSSNLVLGIQSGFYDLGANLFTDPSFPTSTVGEGASKQVAVSALKLSALALNQTSPVNTGSTKTVAIGADSIASNYYSDTSPGALDGITRNNQATTDQRGAPRPSGVGYDVGAFETSATVSPSPSPSPSTSPGLVVKKTIAKQKVFFFPGSSELTPSAKRQLRKLATEIRSKGLKKISLSGYTATITNAAPSGRKFRTNLSKARANSVEKYLKEQFKKSGYVVSFTIAPKGVANPVKSNKSENGRKLNRRVEIVIK